MTDYFADCHDAETLRARFRALVMEHHPDRGGDAEVMKAVNAQYQKALARVRYGFRSPNGSRYGPPRTWDDLSDVEKEVIRRMTSDEARAAMREALKQLEASMRDLSESMANAFAGFTAVAAAANAAKGAKGTNFVFSTDKKLEAELRAIVEKGGTK